MSDGGLLDLLTWLQGGAAPSGSITVIDAALYYYLTTDSALVTQFGGRAYLRIPPKNPTYPLILFGKLPGSREETFEGGSICRARFQVEVWAQTFAEAVVLADLVRRRISIAPTSWGGMPILDYQVFDNEDVDDSNEPPYGVSRDYELMHDEYIESGGSL